MSRTFTPEAFVAFLTKAAADLPAATERGLHAAARKFEAAAKDELGTYQRENTGPTPSWAELADATKADRTRQGYTPNDPGLRRGDMRDATQAKVEVPKVVLGNTMPEARWFNDGTPRQPPRPFIDLALWREQPGETERIARFVYGAMTGNEVSE